MSPPPLGGMNMKYALMAACAVIVSAPASHAQDLSQFFSSYIAFGDSLTDDGKFEGTPFEPGLPGLDGRFSNGPTYAEIIAQDFTASGQFSANFAIGGATARAANENALPPQFGTFGGQVATFSAVTSDPFTRAEVGDRPLFSVLFGGNDVLQNVGLPDGATAPGNIDPTIGTTAADAVEANIRAIGALDEDFNDFLVLNLPDVSETPLFQNELFGASALAPLAALQSAAFNNRLAENIDSLRDDGFNIIEFDLNAFSAAQRVEFAGLGIDVDTPCSFDLSNPGPENTCVFSPGSPDNTDLSLANNFLFIDGVHPNALSQAGSAAAIQSAVAATVPLPAGLPLLLAGLGVFGFFRYRRAA